MSFSRMCPQPLSRRPASSPLDSQILKSGGESLAVLMAADILKYPDT